MPLGTLEFVDVAEVDDEDEGDHEDVASYDEDEVTDVLVSDQAQDVEGVEELGGKHDYTSC